MGNTLSPETVISLRSGVRVYSKVIPVSKKRQLPRPQTSKESKVALKCSTWRERSSQAVRICPLKRVIR
jgi:hypothetical protein